MREHTAKCEALGTVCSCDRYELLEGLIVKLDKSLQESMAHSAKLYDLNAELVGVLEEMYAHCTAETCNDSLAFRIRDLLRRAKEGK